MKYRASLIEVGTHWKTIALKIRRIAYLWPEDGGVGGRQGRSVHVGALEKALLPSPLQVTLGPLHSLEAVTFEDIFGQDLQQIDLKSFQ